MRDISTLAQKLPQDVTAVAGVSRSGMFPAAVIAEQMHLHLYECGETDGLRQMGHGWRLDRPDDGRLVIIDDSVASGRAMATLKSATIKREVLYAAVYCSPSQLHAVDISAVTLPLPHYFEWNLFNSIHTPALAVDIDGILCDDPPPGTFVVGEYRLEGCAYEHWITDAPVKYCPRRCVVPLIATGRARWWRDVTERWLERWGIRYERLVMPRNQREWSDPAALKANAYAESGATIFVESDPHQAQAIAARTGKRVICPATSEVHI